MYLFLSAISLISSTSILFNSNLEHFDAYLTTYNKSYTGYNYWNHYMSFKNNIDYINTRNQLNLSYTLGLTPFTDIHKDDFNNMFKGYNKKNVTYNTNHRCHSMTLSNPNIEYDTIDWRAEGQVTDIKDQGQCGSCWAFSAVAVLESAWFRKTGNLISLSEQDLVDCVTDCYGCNGGWPSYAIEYIINGSMPNSTLGDDNYTKGILSEASYSYTATDQPCAYNKTNIVANFTELVILPKESVSHLQDALLSIGPISVAINANDDFQHYSSGLFEVSNDECDPTELDHAVTAVGLGTTSKGKRYYIIKNSWGTDWGQDGYIYFSADVPNMCGIAEDTCYAMA
jgi:cathepsin L